MKAQTSIRILAGLIGAGAFSLVVTGCGASPDEQTPSPDEPAVGTVSGALDSKNRTCGGYCITNYSDYATCKWTAPLRYYTNRPNVTQDCRERIVEYCHNRGWRFGDAFWSYDRIEEYRCEPKPI